MDVGRLELQQSHDILQENAFPGLVTTPGAHNCKTPAMVERQRMCVPPHSTLNTAAATKTYSDRAKTLMEQCDMFGSGLTVRFLLVSQSVPARAPPYHPARHSASHPSAPRPPYHPA
jgi:hypothetical protein